MSGIVRIEIQELSPEMFLVVTETLININKLINIFTDYFNKYYQIVCDSKKYVQRTLRKYSKPATTNNLLTQ